MAKHRVTKKSPGPASASASGFWKEGKQEQLFDTGDEHLPVHRVQIDIVVNRDDGRVVVWCQAETFDGVTVLDDTALVSLQGGLVGAGVLILGVLAGLQRDVSEDHH